MATEPMVFRRRDGLWDWRLKAKNGQIVATSGGQGYTEENDAHEAAQRVIELLQEEDEGEPTGV